MRFPAATPADILRLLATAVCLTCVWFAHHERRLAEANCRRADAELATSRAVYEESLILHRQALVWLGARQQAQEAKR